MQTARLVLREMIVTFGPALIALLSEAQRQIQTLQQPDWRTLGALALAQIVTIIARFSVPPTSPASVTASSAANTAPTAGGTFTGPTP